MHYKLHCDHIVMVLFSVLCRLDLTPKPPVAKNGMGTVSWLNAETVLVERVPTSLIGRLVRCSAHALFYVRLQ